ncbi:CoA transferase [Achromobacter sp. GG226]|uniref:CaiB/BaiF CoA transferase family protein n=1 Tax=Verticiella alkaliphila TaxID=2779529 RepID=UPI001C0E148B|nr:CoA transferase [Verticiella sp. GG226]MBU4612167.1 CoA transferase [Verticiella sp. GG226]
MSVDLPLPFADLRILDLSQGIAGPYCTHILWQQGAHVTKAEPPAGDWGRGVGTVRGEHSALSLAYNAGKRGLCVDARAPQGQVVLRRLAAQADVVVQNFRPGVAERMGMGAEALCAAHPGLVYVSISGYGPDGPFADAPASDSVMQAETGLMFGNQDAEGEPRRLGMLLADIATAVYAAQAASAALYRRAMTGRGSHVQISLLQACLALQSGNLVEYALAGERRSGAVSAPNGVFRAADGLLSIVVLNDDQFARLSRALDRPDWLTDARFADNPGRMAHRAELDAAITAQLREADVAVWTARFREHDVLHAPVRDYAGVLAHPQAAHQGLFTPLTQPGLPPLPLATVPALGVPREAAPAPAIGEHTRAVLVDAGFASEDITALLHAKTIRQASTPEATPCAP